MVNFPRRKPRKNHPVVPKTLHSELQRLVAFACYDSKEILRSGNTLKKDTLIKKMYELYMPSQSNKDHYSMVEQFLDGVSCFKFLFEEEDGSKIIPHHFHGLDHTVFLGRGGVDMSLLTRKNLTNYADVKPDRLYVHAKKVETNFKKALALVTSPDCPYKDKSFPSGHNWTDYLDWVNNAFMKMESDMKAEKEVEKVDDNDDEDVSVSGDTETVPPSYFHGFLVFALWGHIPPWR